MKYLIFPMDISNQIDRQKRGMNISLFESGLFLGAHVELGAA